MLITTSLPVRIDVEVEVVAGVGSLKGEVLLLLFKLLPLARDGMGITSTSNLLLNNRS